MVSKRITSSANCQCPAGSKVFINYLQSGFTLVEVLVATSILLGGALVVTGLFNLSTSSLFKSRNYDSAHALIESDQSEIRQMAEEYSCCAGTCSTNEEDCTNGNVGDSYYYFPNSNTDDDARSNFFDLCAGTSVRLSQKLIDEINSMQTSALANAGVTREVDFYSETDSDHLISIRYTSAAGSSVPIDRVLVVQPTVSAWCR